MPINTEERPWCVSIPEAAKLIVYGHKYGTVRRWDAHTCRPFGEPMHNRTRQKNSVAIRGNLIVSGSKNNLLYRCNAATGNVIVNALEGHEDSLPCFATTAHRKLIVSVSEDRAIRRWDADTGEAVSSSL